MTKAAERRRYHDACSTAHALDLVGERWALLVMRELLLGPKRFSDLRADLPGISANVLTQHLAGLKAIGLLVRHTLPPPARVQVYELTQWGYDAEPIIISLGRWATRSPAHDPTLPLSATSLMLSFRTMFDPARAGGLDVRIGCRFGAETFLVRIAHGALAVSRGPIDGAAVVFAGKSAALAEAVYGQRPLKTLEAEGALTIEGDRTLAERFATLFSLSSKER